MCGNVKRALFIDCDLNASLKGVLFLIFLSHSGGNLATATSQTLHVQEPNLKSLQHAIFWDYHRLIAFVAMQVGPWLLGRLNT